MSSSNSTKLLAAGAIWLLLFAAGAVAWRMIVRPKQEEDLVRRTVGDARHSRTARIAIDSFSGYCLFRSDEFRDELSSRGIALELVDDKADYQRRLESLADGSTPLAVFTIDALVKTSAVRGDLPATVVMVVDETTGADALVAYKQALPNIDALNRADARIVVTRDSPSETLARVVTSTFRLPELPADCWIDAQGAADVYRQLGEAKASEPKAFALWEPYVTKALENPQVHTLVDSSRFRGYIVDVLVVQRQFLLNQQELVREVVEAYHSAAYSRRQQPGGMVELVSQDARQQGEPLTPQQTERLVQGVWWKNTQENYGHFGLGSAASAGSGDGRLQHLDEMIRKITKVLLDTGAIHRDPTGGSPNKLYYDKILAGMLSSNWHPSALAAGDREEGVRLGDTSRPLEEDQWQRLAQVGHLQVDPIVFARGRAQLIDSSEAVLLKLVDTLRSWPHYYLVVRGHARAEGDPEANRRLANERAQAVAEFLASQGIAEHRVHAEAAEIKSTGGDQQTVSFVLGQTPY